MDGMGMVILEFGFAMGLRYKSLLFTPNTDFGFGIRSTGMVKAWHSMIGQDSFFTLGREGIRIRSTE